MDWKKGNLEKQNICQSGNFHQTGILPKIAENNEILIMENQAKHWKRICQPEKVKIMNIFGHTFDKK